MFPPKHLQRIRLTKSVEISMNSPLSVYNLLLRQMKLYVLCDCHDGNASTMVHSMKVLVTVAKRECHVLVELVVVKMVLLKQSLKAPLRTGTFIASFLEPFFRPATGISHLPFL